MVGDPDGARLTSAMLVGALSRRAQSAGGFLAIVRKGDATSGAIILQTLEKGQQTGLFERVSDYRGGYRLAPSGPAVGEDEEAVSAYLDRRVRADPDLWIVELDIAQAERFAAETIC